MRQKDAFELLTESITVVMDLLGCIVNLFLYRSVNYIAERYAKLIELSVSFI